jgi:transcriptional/translational regulatory protein YebC/TACO1
MKWAENDIKFLKDEFPSKGTKFVADNLNRTISSIEHKAQKLGLKINKERKTEKSKINSTKRVYNTNYKVPNLLEIDITDEIAYILGILWTDGYFSIEQKSIGITILKEDMDDLEPLFQNNGKWYSYLRKRENRNDTKSLSCYNPDFVKSLITYDFDNKSILSPLKIWNKIPDILKKFFFRGVIDGDGCFYINKKNSAHQFTVYSTYEQDWTLYEQILTELNCKFSINRHISKIKNSKSSCLRISNKKDIIKLINWLYEGYEQDNIGLKRKYNKALKIIE